MKRRKLEIAAIYDTETCNVGKGEDTRAYPILFIDNDIRGIDLYNYEPGRDDKVYFYRYEDEMLERIDEYIAYGEIMDVVPIICAYNLMFDLQPLMETLNDKYEIKANAQSSTNVYTIDLFSEGRHVLRFWDTYHLEMRGLAAMGETAGLPKAKGKWDYSLQRTPETRLTDLELFYAARDTQVIPAYLRYLLHANEWMRQEDLGNRVITKTSIVRQMARREIEPLQIDKKDGKKLKLGYAFLRHCKKEMPLDFNLYALRKACFRGGFTFTAARYASTIQRNVVSVDVTSMHHTFINGRYCPQDFKVQTCETVQLAALSIINTDIDYVLNHYEKPFLVAIHAVINFTNVRLRKGSCFEEWGIALEAMSKFSKNINAGKDIGTDPKEAMQDNYNRSRGWHDVYDDALFAFGKLYEGNDVSLHLTELELWTFSRVYEWDEMTVLFGEMTRNWKLPPDYVTLQSNKLYEQKNAAKIITKNYRKGEPYSGDLKFIPDGIANELRNGTLEPEFFEQWYISTVKGMFNGIFGTQAQDVYKPEYKCDEGNLIVDTDTITTEENFEEKTPRSTRVFYNYGMRIVGGSRMHMVIGLELIYKNFGNRVRVLGGDTDSMKMSCDEDVSDEEIERALEPIAIASTKAINKCMQRLRNEFPGLTSGLGGIGGFEIENKGRHYPLHLECWNKTRVSFDGKNTHITAAGLPRPIGFYTIETLMDDLIAAGYSPESVLQECVGYNVFVSYDISHTLSHHKPDAQDLYIGEVTDYQGNTANVCAHQSTALYEAGRWLGETLKVANRFTVSYLESKYGRIVDTTCRYLRRTRYVKEDGTIFLGKGEVLKDTIDGPTIIMTCKGDDRNERISKAY